MYHSHSDYFWFRTDYHAPLFRVVRITLPDLTGMTDKEVSLMRFSFSWKHALEWIPEGEKGQVCM